MFNQSSACGRAHRLAAVSRHAAGKAGCCELCLLLTLPLLLRLSERQLDWLHGINGINCQTHLGVPKQIRHFAAGTSTINQVFDRSSPDSGRAPVHGLRFRRGLAAGAARRFFGSILVVDPGATIAGGAASAGGAAIACRLPLGLGFVGRLVLGFARLGLLRRADRS